MSPLTHAVRFIDDEETDLARDQSLEEVAILESLGSEIEELAFTFFNLSMRLACLTAREMRMHCNGIDALRGKLVFLVLHQRNERAYNYRKARCCQRGELINERFAAASRHNDKSVSSFEKSRDWCPLSLSEITMAKALTQEGASVRLVYLDCHGAKTMAETVP